jgi:hypothetical protein
LLVPPARKQTELELGMFVLRMRNIDFEDETN